MELCSDGHDEVCFESRNCPACASFGDTQIKQQEKSEEIIEGLQVKIEELEDKINEDNKQI